MTDLIDSIQRTETETPQRVEGVAGIIATTPRFLVEPDGTKTASFRFAVFSPEGRAHWYTVTATGPLASNVDRSLNRGDRVILSGTTTVRAWNDRGVEGTTTFIELERCGHDPAWGASR